MNQSFKRAISLLIVFPILLGMMVFADSNEIIVKAGRSGYREIGDWKESSLPDYDGGTTRYAMAKDADLFWAEWHPKLKKGTYRVSYYKIAHMYNDVALKIEVGHAEGTEIITINSREGSSGWIELGAFNFNDGKDGYIKIYNGTKGTVGIAVRAGSVKFAKADPGSIGVNPAPTVAPTSTAATPDVTPSPSSGFVPDIKTERPVKPSIAPSWTSRLLTKDKDGAWQYNNIAVEGKLWNIGRFDFSYAGYKYGETEGMTGIPSNSRAINTAPDEDITAKLNQAIEELGKSGGGVVNIPAGSYTVGTAGAMVNINYDNILIKGAGAGVTKLRIPGSFISTSYWDSGVFNWNGDGFWRSSPEITTVPKGTKLALGAKTIPVVDASSINVGDYVVIRQIMWESFVRKHSSNKSKAPKNLEWTDYDANNKPLFSDPQYAFGYYRKVTAKEGNNLTLDVPIAYELDPANNKISVGKPSGQRFNCGMEGITFTMDAQAGKPNEYNSTGTVLMIKGLVNGWFKDINITTFNSLAFATEYPVGVTFENCIAQNARNRGTGGTGYAFYIKGQNLLYKDCYAYRVRHGWTTASSYTSNVVIKNCKSEWYGFNPEINYGGEAIDDTHLQYAHAILWDNHYANEAGLMMMNRGTLSSKAYQTCGWAVVWNYYNTGNNTPDSYGKLLHRNELAVSPGDFGLVIGVNGPKLKVLDGYGRYPNSSFGLPISNPNLQLGKGKLADGSQPQNVLYEGVGKAGLEPASLYDVMYAKRR